jgi:ATP-binding cassette subfamily G (WHITE) protein 2
MAVIILPMALEISRLYGGFFVSPGSMPGYYKWLEALSYCNYTYIAISLSQLNGLVLSCTPAQIASGVECTGEQTANNLGLNYLTIAECGGILVAYIFICRLFCYIALRYIKW